MRRDSAPAGVRVYRREDRALHRAGTRPGKPKKKARGTGRTSPRFQVNADAITAQLAITLAAVVSAPYFA